ncbi:MAG TPA: TetR/AcrR family transcriptional regulator [Flavobacteriaceae bacterium]|nr:TetR/AcrR family transcriptional regulator [Flavobacteriaceae bacterium]
MSPRTEAQLEALKLRRKEQIIKKSLVLFAKNGYFNTSISDIAKATGISKGLLYNYFENKEALLNEVVLFALKEGTDLGLSPEALSQLNPDEVFVKVVGGYFDLLKEKEELWRLTTSLAIHVSSIPSAHKIIKSVYEDLTSELEAMFTMIQHDNPKSEAFKLGALLDGIGIQYLIFGDEYPLEDIKESIIDNYLKRK